MTKIERLEQKNRRSMVECIRAEAIKEFAERLKMLCRDVDESDIDNLVKEMVGED